MMQRSPRAGGTGGGERNVGRDAPETKKNRHIIFGKNRRGFELFWHHHRMFWKDCADIVPEKGCFRAEQVLQ